MTTYKEAGVDIEAGDEAVKRISSLAKSTFNSNVLSDIGSFGGCYNFPSNDYDDPVLVSSADGVGTKLKLAFLSNIHDTVGQCLVNHCVNDILVMGAKPLFFLDYFAAGKLNANVLESVVTGLSIACKENNCVLIGGETAEMPDFYSDGEYDISGTIVGAVDKQSMIPKRSIGIGDVLIGLPSTGLHTNGYSLARKVLLDRFGIDGDIPGTNLTVKDSLLSIHKSYLRCCEGILNKDWLHGISHITGGGIVNNTSRVLKDGQNLDIDWGSWERPDLFKAIQEIGSVPEKDIRQSMNLGIGLILIVDPKNVNDCLDHLDKLSEKHYIIGKVK